MKQYNLPTGGKTASLDEYLHSWDSIGKTLSEKYNLEIIGFDPTFSAKNKDCSYQYVENPAWLALRMIK